MGVTVEITAITDDGRAAPKLKKEAVAKFLGFYHDEEAGRDYEMVFQDGALAVRVPGVSSPLEFDPPDAEGYRVLQVNPQVRIHFNEEEEARVVSYTACARGGERTRRRIEKDSRP